MIRAFICLDFASSRALCAVSSNSPMLRGGAPVVPAMARNSHTSQRPKVVKGVCALCYGMAWRVVGGAMQVWIEENQ